MYLSKLLSIARSYFWLLILATVVAGFATLIVIRNQPTVYEAKTQLLVGPGLSSASPDLNSLRIGGQLIQTYAELVQTRPFLEAVNDKLDAKMDLASLENMIETRQNVDTRILTIVVRSSDAEQAVAVANAVAVSLIEASPSEDNTTSLLRVQMTEQSRVLEQIIASAQINIPKLEAELVKLGSVTTTTPEDVQALLDQKSLVINQLAGERTRLSDALRTQTSIYQVLLDTNTNQVEVIEPASAVNSVNQNLPLRAATSGMAGLIFALIIILAIEYLDRTIRVPAELSDATGSPLLAEIQKHSRLTGSELESVVAFAQPQSRAANGYRTAVARLLSAIDESAHYRVLCSDVGIHSTDGAASTAVNLAVAFAQAGKQVALIDTQFENPVLTKLFKSEDKPGLSDLLSAKPPKLSFVTIKELPGVHFMPVGLSADKGAGAVMNSVKTSSLFTEMQQEVDLILIAAAPISSSAESLSLASQAQGVILVARQGEVLSKTFDSLMDSLRAMHVNVVGTIFDHNGSPFASTQNFITKSIQGLRSGGKRGTTVEPTLKS